jgi:pimeloyl-ACP methyl ester carboxylesterase
MRALVAAGYRVIAPDQRGYSPGARPPNPGDYSIPNLVFDAVGILGALGVDRFHVVGHDWGAAVAWGLALLVPGRVESLTSISIPAPGALYKVLADHTSCQYSDSAYFDTFTAPNSEDFFLAGGGLVLRFMYSELPPDAQCEYFSALDSKPALSAAFDWYRANVSNRQLTLPIGAHVTVPTMVIWGDKDPFICEAGIDISGQFVDAPYRLEVLHGIDHWVPELAANQVNALLLEHVGSASGTRDH